MDFLYYFFRAFIIDSVLVICINIVCLLERQELLRNKKMYKINKKKTLILIVLFCSPTIMWATRGNEDYGIVMVIMAMLFSFPVGLTLLGFIIFSVSKLRSKKKLKKNQGKTVFIISIIIIVFSVIIPIALMYSASWHTLMVEVMLADFMPILILAIISLVLSMRVKKRSLENE